MKINDERQLYFLYKQYILILAANIIIMMLVIKPN